VTALHYHVDGEKLSITVYFYVFFNSIQSLKCCLTDMPAAVEHSCMHMSSGSAAAHMHTFNAIFSRMYFLPS